MLFLVHYLHYPVATQWLLCCPSPPALARCSCPPVDAAHHHHDHSRIRQRHLRAVTAAWHCGQCLHTTLLSLTLPALHLPAVLLMPHHPCEASGFGTSRACCAGAARSNRNKSSHKKPCERVAVTVIHGLSRRASYGWKKHPTHVQRVMHCCGRTTSPAR